VLYTPALFPSLFEPCDFFYYNHHYQSSSNNRHQLNHHNNNNNLNSPYYTVQDRSAQQQQQHHGGGEENNELKFEELNQSVNNLLGNTVNTAQSVMMNPWAREFKDITNSSQSSGDMPTADPSRAVDSSVLPNISNGNNATSRYEKRWLQNNYTCFVPSNSATAHPHSHHNNQHHQTKKTFSNNNDSENRVRRFNGRNVPYMLRNQADANNSIGQQQQQLQNNQQQLQQPFDTYLGPNGQFFTPKKTYVNSSVKLNSTLGGVEANKNYFNSRTSNSTGGYKYAGAAVSASSSSPAATASPPYVKRPYNASKIQNDDVHYKNNHYYNNSGNGPSVAITNGTTTCGSVYATSSNNNNNAGSSNVSPNKYRSGHFVSKTRS
jgi:hypothetical protein